MLCCLVRLTAAIFMGCVLSLWASFFFSAPLLSQPRLSPLLLYTLSSCCFPVHTYTRLFHTHIHICRTFFTALFTVLICIGTGEKIKKTLKQAQRQKLYLNLLKEVCIRFWLVFLCRCYPWVIPWRNNSLFVWLEQRARQEERWIWLGSACDTPRHSVIIPCTWHIYGFYHCLLTRFQLCLLAWRNVYVFGKVGINKLVILESCL